jgi:glycosyltransferase involved in cell wall biosynthesis
MNILIVGTASPLRGGIAHYIALLYRYLNGRHNVEVVTFSRQYPTWLFPGKSQEEQGGEEAAIPAEQLIDSINPFTWLTAAKRIAAKKPDLLIFKYWLPFFGPCFGFLSRQVKKRTGAKVLFICDNVIPHERRLGDILFTRYAFRAVDYFIVQSKSVERDLVSFWPGAVWRFSPHPIYEIFGKAIPKTEARRQLRLTDERVILFFGYVRRYKGLLTLLRAMPTILNQVRLKLLVVGEFYDDEAIYHKTIADLNLENSIVVKSDYVPSDEVKLYFSASDVVVLPYNSATQSGIVQIAYQFDKPVIATSVGGLPEVVLEGKTGMLVPPEEPGRLAEAVIQFYREKKEGEFVGNIRNEKKKYSWDHLINVIEAFFSKSD